MVNAALITKISSNKYFQNFLVSLLLLFLVLIVLQQANPLYNQLEGDSGNYIYVSNTFLKGGLPYVTAMETKPPGIFFIDAFALWIGDGTRWGIWLIEFLFLLVTTFVGFYTLYYQFGFAPALVGSAVWLQGLNLTLGGGNLTEEYSLLFGFSSLLLWVLSEKKANTIFLDSAIGICAGCSALLRPNNAGVQFSIVLVILITGILNKKTQIAWRRLIVIFLFALMPLCISAYYFYLQGAFQEFLEGSFIYNFTYTGSNFDFIESLIEGFGSLGFPIGVGLVGYFVVIQVSIQAGISKSQPFFLWILVDGVLEIFLSSLSGRGFAHYFICWLPVVAAATASLVFLSLPFFCDIGRKYASWIVLFMILVCFTLFPTTSSDYINTAVNLWYRRVQIVDGKKDAVVEYIETHTLRNDFVLVWGGRAGINYLSDRDTPTPYIFYPIYLPSQLSKRWSYEYYLDIQEKPPTLIVDGSCFAPGDLIALNEKKPEEWVAKKNSYENSYLIEILSYINQHYSLINNVNDCDIYRLNE